MTNVLITIDVESFSNGNPKTDIYGNLENISGEWGIGKIMELFETNNYRATFFLNVYEFVKHGEDELERVANKIVARGHDLQLHTHPKYVCQQDYMSTYNLEEQKRILKLGIDMIKKWTGKNVIAHRAGSFSANFTTLRALKEVGILIDSSLSPAYNSPLYEEGYEQNDIVNINNIIEIPITYYSQFKFLGWKSNRFLDIESSTFREIKLVLNQAANQNFSAVNIMMHSFSFTRKGFPDKEIVDRLNNVLRYIDDHPNLSATTIEEFATKYAENSLMPNPRQNFIPHSGLLLTYLRSWERILRGWKNIVFALSIPSCILIAIIIKIFFYT